MAAILDIAAFAVQAKSEEEWWEFVAGLVLGPLFRADVVAVNVLNMGERYGWFSVVYPDAARLAIPVNSPMDHILLTDHPFSERLAHGPVAEPMKVTDLLSQRQWASRASYGRMRELTGGAHHLTLHFRSPAGHQESLSIVRADNDFSTAEMRLARRLQAVADLSITHLREIARLTSARPPAQEQTARNAARALGISSRERVVLELVDRGLNTKSIGRQLGISPQTVYKHQQNIYRKLGVHDRLTALARARRHLLIVGRQDQSPADRTRLAPVGSG